MKKRNMSLILVLALILCLIPATAFADGTTIPTTVTDTVTVDGTATIATNTTVTTGKIIVPDDATLTISAGKYLWLDSKRSDNEPLLEIEDGGELVVNGKLADLGSDVVLNGKITVTGTNSDLVVKNGTNVIEKVGGNANCKLKLGDNAVATITSLGETSADGYKYVISGGTATTNNFTNSGKDELVVADGAVLDASAGMTLGGSSTKQLTVQDGGKLILPTNTTNAQTILESAYGEGDQKITSGTYSLDPSKVGSTPTSYVATGYKVVDNEDGTYTVKPAGLLSKIAVVVKEPVVGETPATTYTSTVTADKSATAIDRVIWYKVAKADYVDLDDPKASDVWTRVGEGEKFQKGYYYAFMTAFVITDGYEVSDNLAVTVNAKKADLVYDSTDADADADADTVTIAKVFGPLAEKSPVTGDNNELGLFAVAGLISALGVALMLRRKHSM